MKYKSYWQKEKHTEKTACSNNTAKSGLMHFAFQINEIIVNVTKKLNTFSNLKSAEN